MLKLPTLHITGSKKQSEERAALFGVRIYGLVGQHCFAYIRHSP
uniref:Uncharacterized protein n=1 Tax=Candidatus Kentrum sp. TC TaxID=2126339 RepID=A0A450ZA59_9GAMM|nr:MAG: hypothetical protein BECKTC1821E_GA0114239_110515 [Candidatus Kentron sp. TC]VFK50681.1 MAG: hypothetical protein BECKTC1821D_GA0114238_11175 [Candidatus Kentron sp. TC]VFK59872.1 MAG: hypothetical protein BECKTC1821F_GA0114240_103815 [Candidatus Kentron sp. TC]